MVTMRSSSSVVSSPALNEKVPISISACLCDSLALASNLQCPASDSWIVVSLLSPSSVSFVVYSP